MESAYLLQIFVHLAPLHVQLLDPRVRDVEELEIQLNEMAKDIRRHGRQQGKIYETGWTVALRHALEKKYARLALVCT